MVMQQVKSSFIARVGYSPQLRILRVAMKNGQEYDYFDVPAEEHAEWMAAESIGSHYGRRIKGRFSTRENVSHEQAA